MSDTGTRPTNAESVQDTPLTIREHLDPDKHWIGEALAPPSQGEIEATVGTTAGPGESPYVARADHRHKLDQQIFPVTLLSGAANVDATASGTFTSWVDVGNVTIPSWATSAVVHVDIASVTPQTTNSNWAFNVTIGAAAVGTTDFATIVFPVAGESMSVGFAKTITLSGTGSQNVMIYTRRTGGTGGLRAVTALARFSIMVWFRT